MNSHCEEGDRARRGNLNLNRFGLRNDTVFVTLIYSAFTQGEGYIPIICILGYSSLNRTFFISYSPGLGTVMTVT